MICEGGYISESYYVKPSANISSLVVGKNLFVAFVVQPLGNNSEGSIVDHQLFFGMTTKNRETKKVGSDCPCGHGHHDPQVDLGLGYHSITCHLRL